VSDLSHLGVFPLDADGDLPPLRTLTVAGAGLVVDPLNDELFSGSRVYSRSDGHYKREFNTVNGIIPYLVTWDASADELYVGSRIPERTTAQGLVRLLDVFPASASGTVLPLRESTAGPSQIDGSMTADCASGDVFVASETQAIVLRGASGFDLVRRLDFGRRVRWLSVGP
jgi:hypothetical protein